MKHAARISAGLATIDGAGWIVVDHVSTANAGRVLDSAGILADRQPAPVLVLTCDLPQNHRAAFAAELEARTRARCLAVVLDGPLPRRTPAIAAAIGKAGAEGIDLNSAAAT